MLMRPDGSLTRQGRLLRTGVFLVLLIAGVVVGSQAVAAGDTAPGTDGTVVLDGQRKTPSAASVLGDTHTVSAGETLWSIAASVKRPGEDTRDVIDRIMELNGMDSTALTAGEQILVPVVP